MVDAGTWLHKLDEAQQRRPWLALPLAVMKKFGDDRAGGAAALVAYYGFFSLFPLLLVLVTLLGLILADHPDIQQRVVSSALAQFPIVGSDIQRNVHAIPGSIVALVVGLAGAIWAGLGVVEAAQQAMDGIWDVPRSNGPSFFRRKARGLLLLGTLGLVIGLGTLSAGLGASLGDGAVGPAMAFVFAAGINIGACTVAFMILTVAGPGWRDVLPGAILTGSVWTILQGVGGALVSHQIRGAGDTYGFFAVVIGLLWWIYLGAQILLVGGELNVVRNRHLWPRSIFGPPSRPQDHQVVRLQAMEQQMTPEEEASVSFDPPGPGRGV